MVRSDFTDVEFCIEVWYGVCSRNSFGQQVQVVIGNSMDQSSRDIPPRSLPLQGQGDWIDQVIALRHSNQPVPDHLLPVSRLLDLLDTPIASPASDLLSDVTIARIMHTAAAVGDGHSASGLSPADEEALDALILARFEVDEVAPALRERAARVASIGTSLRESQIVAPADLTDRVMARIESAGEARTISIETARPRRNWRIGDLVGIAAALLLGTSVLWPMVSAARMDSVKTACLSNMRTVGGGMGMYANEYRDAMPVATAGLGGGRWWDVGRETASNSRNLFTLVRKGFVKVEDLACPGNPGCRDCCVTPDCEDWKSLEEVSYSYQIMLGGHRPAWLRPGGNPSQTIVMADRSPVVLKNARGEAVSPIENSPNHQGAGQHALYSDGHVGWIGSPEVTVGNGPSARIDNIWLPQPVEIIIRQIQSQLQSGQGFVTTQTPMLRGTEIPDENDIFLGP